MRRAHSALTRRRAAHVHRSFPPSRSSTPGSVHLQQQNVEVASLWRWGSLGTAYKRCCSCFQLLAYCSFGPKSDFSRKACLLSTWHPLWASLVTCEAPSTLYRYYMSFPWFPVNVPEDILCLAARCPGIEGGVVYVLGDILACDTVHMLLAGSAHRTPS